MFNKLFFQCLCLIFASLGEHLSEAKNKYNVSLSQLDYCDVYDIPRSQGYAYRKFFHLSTLSNNNQSSANESVHLKFYVMTAMDAHILLSVNDHPRQRDKVYEIVVGGGSNTFSTIRMNMGRSLAVDYQHSQLLSVHDPTPIEVVQFKNGNLSVYIPGFKVQPFLTFVDESPLNVNYISFSSYGSISAKWFYDCPFDGFNAEMEEEKHFKTPRQQLLASVQEQASNKSMPLSLQNITFQFHLRSIAFQQNSYLLTTRVNLILHWSDGKLAWTPADFGNIEYLISNALEIWTPTLVVLNGASRAMLNVQPSYELKLHANGNVTMEMRNLELHTRCLNFAQNWPNEALICEVLLGLQDAQYGNQQTIDLLYENRMGSFDDAISTLSEWSVHSIGVDHISSGNRQRYNEEGQMKITNGDVSIEFEIERNNRFYRNVFIVPILTAQTLIILSFLLRGYRRGALVLVVFIIVSLGLMFITKHAPVAYVPNIILAYQHLMRLATFCYLLHVAIMWLELYPPKHKPNEWVMALVNSSPLRLVLCMRFSDSSEYVAIQEYPWNEIAKILNNFSFVIVNLVLILLDVALLPNV